VRAGELGADFLCLTGNPGSGVRNAQITETVRLCRELFDGLVIAGKMHGAGAAESVVDRQAVEDHLAAGADIILRIAHDNKIAGADIQHIGDAGPGGLADPMNIYTLSETIRGRRHTISRMARSTRR